MSIINRCHEPTILSLIHKNSSQPRKNAVYSDLTNTINLSTQPICWGCLKTAEKISLCILCKVAHYCTRVCQKTDWEFHKLECPQMKIHILPLKNASKREKACDNAVKETLRSRNNATSDSEPTPLSRDQHFSQSYELKEKSLEGDDVSELLKTLQWLLEIKNISSQPTQSTDKPKSLIYLESQQINEVVSKLKEKNEILQSSTNKSDKKKLSKEIVSLEIKHLELEIQISETQTIDRKNQLAKKTHKYLSAPEIFLITTKETLLDEILKKIQEMKLSLYDLKGAFHRRAKHTPSLTLDEQQYLLTCNELRYKKYNLEINYLELVKVEYETYFPKLEIKEIISIISSLKTLSMILTLTIQQQKKAKSSFAPEIFSYEEVD